MCYVHILFSNSLNKFYVGHCCENIEERIRKHLSNHSRYTAKAKDWKLVYHETAPDKQAVYKRELEIKSWKSRKKNSELINNQLDEASRFIGTLTF